MMHHRMTLTAATIMLASAAQTASAATVTGRFTYDHRQTVTIASTPYTGNVAAVRFEWSRRDTPGSGVDSSVAARFTSFCVDLEQVVRQGNDYRFNVLTTAQAGYTPEQDLALRTLWSQRIDSVVSATTAAAFQLAVWEIRYDTDMMLATGQFRATAGASAVAMAQQWLDGVTAAPTNRTLPELVVLQSATAQDQITVYEVPEPRVVACVLAGMATMGRRRRPR